MYLDPALVTSQVLIQICILYKETPQFHFVSKNLVTSRLEKHECR